MDRLSQLREAYEEARVAGEELLKAFREPASEEVIERIDQLVDRRELAIEAAASLFQVGDQLVLQAELKGLAQQQQAVEGEMVRFMGHLKLISQQARKVRSTLEGTRRLMRSGQGGRLLNEIR